MCMQDFSTPSLEGELARKNLEEAAPIANQDDDQLEQYQIARRRQWEQKYVNTKKKLLVGIPRFYCVVCRLVST